MISPLFSLPLSYTHTFFLSSPHSLAHTHIYSFFHTLPLSNTHTHTHNLSSSLFLSHVQQHTHIIHFFPHSPSLTNTLSYSLSLTHTLSYSLSLQLTHTYIHTYTFTYPRSCRVLWPAPDIRTEALPPSTLLRPFDRTPQNIPVCPATPVCCA